MTQFLCCNIYCLPRTQPNDSIDVPQVDQKQQEKTTKKSAPKNKRTIFHVKSNHLARSVTKPGERLSRASVKIDGNSHLSYYKVLMEQSVISVESENSEDENNNIKVIGKEGSRRRDSDICNQTPITTNSVNDNYSESDSQSSEKIKAKNKKIESNKKPKITKNKGKKRPPQSFVDINNAYSKLSKKKTTTLYDENVVYGMPSKQPFKNYAIRGHYNSLENQGGKDIQLPPRILNNVLSPRNLDTVASSYSNSNINLINISKSLEINANSDNVLYPRNYLSTNLETDPNSCSQCEQYYKLALFKNIGLKMFICVFCKNSINHSSLQFYSKKYENELTEEIRKNISAQFSIENSQSANFHSSLPTYENNEFSTIVPTHSKNISILEEKEAYQTEYKTDKRENDRLQTSMEKVDELIFEEEALDSNNNLKRKRENNEKSILSPDLISNQGLLEGTKEEGDDRSEKNQNRSDDEELINEDKGNLAEAFRKRKQALIENFQNRKHLKKLKTFEEKIKVKEPKALRTSNKSISIKSSEKSLISRKTIHEPSPDLIQRLTSGEKANLTKKEIKELNQRMFSKLPDVVKKEKQEQKKIDEMVRLEKQKNFTNKLKDEVVKNKI